MQLSDHLGELSGLSDLRSEADDVIAVLVVGGKDLCESQYVKGIFELSGCVEYAR
ncbi:hypothetical protein D3C83_295870 [compost metagenome]